MHEEIHFFPIPIIILSTASLAAVLEFPSTKCMIRSVYVASNNAYHYSHTLVPWALGLSKWSMFTHKCLVLIDDDGSRANVLLLFVGTMLV